jgi:hypothetical protein
MCKSKCRWYRADGLFVVLIMVAAVASAAMEAVVMNAAMPSTLPSAIAHARPAYTPQAAASAIQLAVRGGSTLRR